MGRKINPPGYHVVDQGDWISKIANWYGFPKWESIWNDPDNAALREKRPDPNLIYPGDRVYIPSVSPKEATGSTAQRHRYRLQGGTITFNLTLVDQAGEPRPGVRYKLSVGCEGSETLVFNKETDNDGLITHTIPKASTTGWLEVDNQVIQLDLGHLDPIETVSGYQARLANLGYDPGPVDGLDGPLTRSGVSEFQADYPPLTVDGICGPKTTAKLKEVYGC